MNTLIAQQQQLHRMIVRRDSGDGLLRSQTGRAPLLRIYQHAYTERLIGALRDNFGVLPQVMGDEAFEALALAYIAAHPSRHPSIRWFGDRLTRFMAERDELVPHPALIDLARMEWALRGAFDAAGAQPLAPAALAAVPPEHWPSLVFEPLPSVQALEMAWAIEPLWRAMQTAHADDAPEPVARAHTLLIWRDGLENRWRVVEPGDAVLLHSMIEGGNFAQLCTLAAEQVGEANAAAAAVRSLQSWLADGLLAGFS